MRTDKQKLLLASNADTTIWIINKATATLPDDDAQERLIALRTMHYAFSAFIGIGFGDSYDFTDETQADYESVSGELSALEHLDDVMLGVMKIYKEITSESVRLFGQVLINFISAVTPKMRLE